MNSINFIVHQDITAELLDKIIEVKSAAWPFSYQSQQEWIKGNVGAKDIHALLSDEHQATAYLNLIEIEVRLDATSYLCYGIGNVCSRIKGMGWGKELINQLNSYLISSNKMGLLFCKPELVTFYKSNNWNVIADDKLIFPNITDEIITMAFNAPGSFKQLEFSGSLF